ncbi:Multidrug resistance protein MdtH [Mycobacterium marinum]|uniref:Multidrug resistance protein MdtH n=1 Tax=Mycobacterium marinum TaxID=1781 RepID=A0A2Z5YCN0_MYCMR|nr:MFS transporter [Mycobacterium marinum]AXN48936.1 Multidrug resistance protein MdtH [Mycobacterium marinum]EPQ79220.1 putative integral membrane transport protein [Mycobacterium marinum str. Europe]RFZ04965.1 Multidrug resistance protein MdtH [Mycobacterium marinum]RFZ14914.1 Multidrug resistance protein MdtH [Mycobacterium marinum]RFZ21263.1 Multidrug resistance protein MdtH [Mycobacterium marinum]
MRLIAEFGSFNYPSRLLMINQLGINLGFFMLMPYLANYLGGTLGLAAWAVGLVIGVRNFAQQGMFFVGGSLADRFGYKLPIVAGCLTQTAAFALLLVGRSLPALLVAAAATGLAVALFTPAVRAYLATDSGDRKVEAFALFNVFYQAGILLGPLVGSVLLALDFRMAVLGAVGVFGSLAVAQLVSLPPSSANSSTASVNKTSIVEDWAAVFGNRPFLRFAVAMTGRYILSSQIYLALPIQAAHLMPQHQSLLVAAMFAISGLTAISVQLRMTGWLKSQLVPGRCLVVGTTVIAVSLVPLAVVPSGVIFGTATAATALLVSAVLLASASAVIFPFEMRTVSLLSGERLAGTYQGVYSTVIGGGVLVGNLGIGWLMDTTHRLNADRIAWCTIILVGLVSAAALFRSQQVERATS